MFSSEKSSSARNFNASGGTRVAQEPPQIHGFLVGEHGTERRRCVRRRIGNMLSRRLAVRPALARFQRRKARANLRKGRRNVIESFGDFLALTHDTSVPFDVGDNRAAVLDNLRGGHRRMA